jgi:hypothetical protein
LVAPPALETRSAIVAGPPLRITRGFVPEAPHVAYQVFGEGPINLVIVPGFVSNIELFWDQAPR